MSIVTLVSGGLDSTLMAMLIKEEGIVQYPLFIDYGQLNSERELRACTRNFSKHGLPQPDVMDLKGYGRVVASGLTDATKHVFDDAFLPGRNLLFATVGAAFAFQRQAPAVAMGLLDDAFSIFPDQTRSFVSGAEDIIASSLGRRITLLMPLMTFSKADVLHIARERKINGTYSCHAGGEKACGNCIACREYIGLEE